MSYFALIHVLTLEELLLQLGLGDLYLDSLVHLLVVAPLVVGIVFDCRREERVDEGGLSQTRFTSDLEQLDQHFTVPPLGFTMIVNAAPRLATILWLQEVSKSSTASWFDRDLPLVRKLGAQRLAEARR